MNFPLFFGLDPPSGRPLAPLPPPYPLRASASSALYCARDQPPRHVTVCDPRCAAAQWWTRGSKTPHSGWGGVLSPSAHLLGSLSTSADQGVRGCGCVCVKAGLGRSTGYLLKLRLAHGLTGLCAIFSVSCVSVTIKIHLKVILPWGGFSVEMKRGETYPKKSHRA